MTSSSARVHEPPTLRLAEVAVEEAPSRRLPPRGRRSDLHDAHDRPLHASRPKVHGSRSTEDLGEGASVEELLAAAEHAHGAERAHLLERATVSQLGLARSMAMRYRDRGEPLDDLVQVANLALVMAVQRYRPDQGVPFAAFAVPTITGELRRHFRDRGWNVRPPRRLQELRARVQSATHDLSQELGHAPSIEQLAHRLGVDPEEVREAEKAAEGYHSLSLDAPTATGEGPQLADWLGADDEQFGYTVDALAVRPLLARLDERMRHILCLRYYRGCTQQQIADEIGVTQMQVSRLISQALARLRQSFDEDDAGPDPFLHAQPA
jgi:RNA polymerase sigma-B factor